MHAFLQAHTSDKSMALKRLAIVEFKTQHILKQHQIHKAGQNVLSDFFGQLCSLKKPNLGLQ
jgi:hypothetical protein